MRQHSLTKVLFVLPCAFAFTMVMLIPFFFGLFYSMTDWNGVSESIKFVGFVHFAMALSEPGFPYSFLITMAYTAINVVLVNAVGFALALLVTSNLRFRNFYRAGFFTPYLIGGIVLGYIWQFIFNSAVPALGKALAIASMQTSLLGSSGAVIWAMSAVNTWQYAGYVMLIFIAAIQAIPASLMEAAKIDGAGYFRASGQDPHADDGQRLHHLALPDPHDLVQAVRHEPHPHARRSGDALHRPAGQGQPAPRHEHLQHGPSQPHGRGPGEGRDPLRRPRHRVARPGVASNKRKEVEM